MATGKSTATCNNFLKLLLNATTWTGVAVNDTGTPLTNLYLALSTGTLTAASTQATTEAAYTSYARAAVARTTGGWSAASGGVSTLVATISFPAATGGSETETYASLGSDSTGAGNVFYWGAVSPNLAVSNGVTPQLTGTSTTVTET